jgi:hypothetical protein
MIHQTDNKLYDLVWWYVIVHSGYITHLITLVSNLYAFLFDRETRG